MLTMIIHLFTIVLGFKLIPALFGAVMNAATSIINGITGFINGFILGITNRKPTPQTKPEQTDNSQQ